MLTNTLQLHGTYVVTPVEGDGESSLFHSLARALVPTSRATLHGSITTACIHPGREYKVDYTEYAKIKLTLVGYKNLY